MESETLDKSREKGHGETEFIFPDFFRQDIVQPDLHPTHGMTLEHCSLCRQENLKLRGHRGMIAKMESDRNSFDCEKLLGNTSLSEAQ